MPKGGKRGGFSERGEERQQKPPVDEAERRRQKIDLDKRNRKGGSDYFGEQEVVARGAILGLDEAKEPLDDLGRLLMQAEEIGGGGDAQRDVALMNIRSEFDDCYLRAGKNRLRQSELDELRGRVESFIRSAAKSEYAATEVVSAPQETESVLDSHIEESLSPAELDPEQGVVVPRAAVAEEAAPTVVVPVPHEDEKPAVNFAEQTVTAPEDNAKSAVEAPAKEPLIRRLIVDPDFKNIRAKQLDWQSRLRQLRAQESTADPKVMVWKMDELLREVPAIEEAMLGVADKYPGEAEAALEILSGHFSEEAAELKKEKATRKGVITRADKLEKIYGDKKPATPESPREFRADFAERSRDFIDAARTAHERCYELIRLFGLVRAGSAAVDGMALAHALREVAAVMSAWTGLQAEVRAYRSSNIVRQDVDLYRHAAEEVIAAGVPLENAKAILPPVGITSEMRDAYAQIEDDMAQLKEMLPDPALRFDRHVENEIGDVVAEWLPRAQGALADAQAEGDEQLQPRLIVAIKRAAEMQDLLPLAEELVRMRPKDQQKGENIAQYEEARKVYRSLGREIKRLRARLDEKYPVRAAEPEVDPYHTGSEKEKQVFELLAQAIKAVEDFKGVVENQERHKDDLADRDKAGFAEAKGQVDKDIAGIDRRFYEMSNLKKSNAAYARDIFPRRRMVASEPQQLTALDRTAHALRLIWAGAPYREFISKRSAEEMLNHVETIAHRLPQDFRQPAQEALQQLPELLDSVFAEYRERRRERERVAVRRITEAGRSAQDLLDSYKAEQRRMRPQERQEAAKEVFAAAWAVLDLTRELEGDLGERQRQAFQEKADALGEEAAHVLQQVMDKSERQAARKSAPRKGVDESGSAASQQSEVEPKVAEAVSAEVEMDALLAGKDDLLRRFADLSKFIRVRKEKAVLEETPSGGYRARPAPESTVMDWSALATEYHRVAAELASVLRGVKVYALRANQNPERVARLLAVANDLSGAARGYMRNMQTNLDAGAKEDEAMSALQKFLNMELEPLMRWCRERAVINKTRVIVSAPTAETTTASADQEEGLGVLSVAENATESQVPETASTEEAAEGAQLTGGEKLLSFGSHNIDKIALFTGWLKDRINRMAELTQESDNRTPLLKELSERIKEIHERVVGGGISSRDMRYIADRVSGALAQLNLHRATNVDRITGTAAETEAALAAAREVFGAEFGAASLEARVEKRDSTAAGDSEREQPEALERFSQQLQDWTAVLEGVVLHRNPSDVRRLQEVQGELAEWEKNAVAGTADAQRQEVIALREAMAGQLEVLQKLFGESNPDAPGRKEFDQLMSHLDVFAYMADLLPPENLAKEYVQLQIDEINRWLGAYGQEGSGLEAERAELLRWKDLAEWRLPSNFPGVDHSELYPITETIRSEHASAEMLDVAEASADEDELLFEEVGPRFFSQPLENSVSGLHRAFARVDSGLQGDEKEMRQDTLLGSLLRMRYMRELDKIKERGLRIMSQDNRLRDRAVLRMLDVAASKRDELARLELIEAETLPAETDQGNEAIQSADAIFAHAKQLRQEGKLDAYQEELSRLGRPVASWLNKYSANRQDVNVASVYLRMLDSFMELRKSAVERILDNLTLDRAPATKLAELSPAMAVFGKQIVAEQVRRLMEIALRLEHRFTWVGSVDPATIASLKNTIIKAEPLLAADSALDKIRSHAEGLLGFIRENNPQ